MNCPNCGDRLVAYRRDRQSAGQARVLLQWAICEGCQHVALLEWQFLEDRIQHETVEADRRKILTTF